MKTETISAVQGAMSHCSALNSSGLDGCYVRIKLCLKSFVSLPPVWQLDLGLARMRT